MMADADRRRLDRLAKRAKKLDDVSQKAEAMNKRIVDELQRMGKADKLITRSPSKVRRKRK